MFGENFAGSIGANAILAVAYGLWKIFDRCQRSKCKMDAEKGLTFDRVAAPSWRRVGRAVPYLWRPPWSGNCH